MLKLTDDEINLLGKMEINVSDGRTLTNEELDMITDILPEEYFNYPNGEPTAECLVAENLYDKALNEMEARGMEP